MERLGAEPKTVFISRRQKTSTWKVTRLPVFVGDDLDAPGKRSDLTPGACRSSNFVFEASVLPLRPAAS
jgi:hypothetical protein